MKYKYNSYFLIAVMLFLSMGCATTQDQLMRAARAGNTGAVEDLLARGADVDSTDPMGRTALMAASAKGYAGIVEALLVKGADLNVKDIEGRNALMLAEMNGHEEVVRILRKAGETAKGEAMRTQPGDAEALNRLGITHGNAERYGEAIEAFKQAIFIDPRFAKAHYNLGLVYLYSGRYPEATAQLKEAIRIGPEHAAAHYHLGVAYLNSGRWDDVRDSAVKEYGILKDLDRELAEDLLRLMKEKEQGVE